MLAASSHHKEDNGRYHQNHCSLPSQSTADLHYHHLTFLYQQVRKAIISFLLLTITSALRNYSSESKQHTNDDMQPVNYTLCHRQSWPLLLIKNKLLETGHKDLIIDDIGFVRSKSESMWHSNIAKVSI